jgi:cytochrome P450
VLRNSDVQQLFTDPRTRQSETEFFEVRGIQGGTLLDLFKYSMVTSNGADYRRHRLAFSTAFAFRAMAADQAGEMSPLEILIQLLFVIVAGSDTTPGALAVQTAQLLQHREQWETVCRDSRLVPGGVAEALRFEPSAASVSRFVLEDIELGGYVPNAGQFMTLSTMSAMCDEKVFEAPRHLRRFQNRSTALASGVRRWRPSMPR